MGKRSLVVFQKHEGVIFFNFSKNYSFGHVGWGVWRKWMGMFFFFCDTVT
jgi:hypothetical protein